ncbi:hypothetical protein [Streptomyces sp. NPDC089795]|uniref:hypothetical protein n=1 Tax=Streptomyces sp. NPDC089795 TaxID=3155297 RepID=UPI0034393B4A
MISTGGGPCDRHEGQQQASVEAAMDLVRLYDPTKTGSLFPAEEPLGEPEQTPLSQAFVARTINLG